jgi:molybdenum cofactor synthesis domain-containing protein
MGPAREEVVHTRNVRGHPTAAIVTIGNEVVSGDIENTNASWLARRLEQLGIVVRLMAAVPDDVEAIATLVRREADESDLVVVTGGLGGTPDDVTREAIASAFGVAQGEHAEVAARLRARFTRSPEYAARWALLPEGARPLEIERGGAPGFVLENVYVLPGLPGEMKPMFESIEAELRRERPISSWRRTFSTRESVITPLLVEVTERYPEVRIGSYPTFTPDGPLVEVVVKSADEDTLAAASEWLAAELDALTRTS